MKPTVKINSFKFSQGEYCLDLSIVNDYGHDLRLDECLSKEELEQLENFKSFLDRTYCRWEFKSTSLDTLRRCVLQIRQLCGCLDRFRQQKELGILNYSQFFEDDLGVYKFEESENSED